MSSSNVENFILRVLAGFDPKDLTPLEKGSVWLDPEVQTAFRELLSPVPEKISEPDDSLVGCRFPF